MSETGAPSQEPAAAAPAAAEPKQPGSGIFFQFIVFPLAIVLIAIAITGLFSWLATDRRSYDEYVNEIQNGWTAKRGQSAYELSFRMADPQDELRRSADVAKTIAAFEAAKKERDPKVRRYLAVVLGYAAQTLTIEDRPRGGPPVTRTIAPNADAVPSLVDALADADDETRLNATWALGRLRDARAVAALTKKLDDPFDGERKIACFALGEIGDASAREPLFDRLGDTAIDVRWNAALALARLKDARALPILITMLDRSALDEVQKRRVPEGNADRLPMSDEQCETVMVNALRGILELEATDALAAVDKAARTDRSYTVRQAAMEAREKLEQKLRSKTP